MQWRARGSEFLVMLAALALPFKATGCGRTACITVTPAQRVNGACPDPTTAEGRFVNPNCGINGITSVDGPGMLDNGLCCYPVTMAGANSGFQIGTPCGVGGGFGVGVGVGTGMGGMPGVGGSTGTTGGVDGGGCASCNQGLQGTAPLAQVCSVYLADLKTCACASNCTTACDPTLCEFDNAPDDPCMACLQMACSAQLVNCMQD